MRPANLSYAVDERPPPLTCALNAMQHVVVMSPALIYVLFVLEAAHASKDETLRAISLSLVALGIGSILQCQKRRYFGSGYLVAFIFDAPYLSASVVAAQIGGMTLVCGMTVFAGLVEMGLSRVIPRMRPFFPAEISGICVMLIGLILGVLGMRLVLGIPEDANAMSAADTPQIILGCATLALMIAIHIWAKESWRTYSIIIGVLVAYGAAWALRMIDPAALHAIGSTPWFDVPRWRWPAPHFAPGLMLAFAFGALVCALSVMGDVTTGQKINDAAWIRPDMNSLRNGVLTDGVCTTIAALLGSVGGDTSSPNIGLSSAAGVTSRIVGYWTGGLLVVLATMPMIAAAVVSIPRPIMGAALLFTACFVMINGLQIIMSRLLDARRTLVIGLSLTLALSRDLFPSVYGALPQAIQPFAASDLVIGLFTALILNAVFRIGVKTRQSFEFLPGTNTDKIREFLEAQGAKWGARRDVIEKAVFGATQAVEVVSDYCAPDGPIIVEAAFDEFNLDIRVTYRGRLIALQTHRPAEDEILESDDGVLKLAGYLVRRNADRVRVTQVGDAATLEFHFQH